MVDSEQEDWRKVAKFLRMLGASNQERRTSFGALERFMGDKGISWSDVGNCIERGGDLNSDAYTESELQQFGQAQREQGVEAGIKIGEAHKSNGGNGAGVLPTTRVMAEYCHQQTAHLKNDWQRAFIADIFIITRGTTHLSLSRLANLAKIYIEIGGRI